MTKRKHSKQKHQHKQNATINPCPQPVNTGSCDSEAPCELETSAPCQQGQQENQITIRGKVMYHGQGVHLATVVVVRNRQVVAECLTDCDGCYEFTGVKGNYFLRAHKNNRRSRIRNVSCANNKYEINFCLN